MPKRAGAWQADAASPAQPLDWPAFPQVAVSLLAATSVAGAFLGLGTLTAQRWVVWLGLALAAGVLASHLFRYRRALERRALARAGLGARLVSRCQWLGGPSHLQPYLDRGERVVLVLADNALHICQPGPLRLFSTIPLYDIHDVQVGQHLGSPAKALRPFFATAPDLLTLAVHGSGPTPHRLTFRDFEPHARAPLWAAALLPRREGAPV